MPSWIVHRICRHVLYVATTFRLSVHPSSYFNGAERRTRILRTKYGAKKPEVGLRYSDVMHAFPFSAISESNSCRQRCLIPKITLTSLAPDGHLKRPGARYGWCAHTVCLQEYPMHSTCAHRYSSSFSESTFFCALGTHEIWTNSCRAHHKLRA